METGTTAGVDSVDFEAVIEADQYREN